MSVQISGSTLFNVLQVTQGFFLADFGGTLKEESEQSGNESFAGVKRRTSFILVLQIPPSLMLSLISRVIHRFPPSALCSVRRHRITCTSFSVCIFQSLLQRILMLILVQFIQSECVCFSSLGSALCQRSQP